MGNRIMKNKNKTSTEYDITIENKQLEKLLKEIKNRGDVYSSFTQFEQEIDDSIKTAEIKVQLEPSVRQYGNVFIEYSMKKPEWDVFRPSGISSTKSDTYILPILQNDGKIGPVTIMVKTKYLNEIIDKGLEEGWVMDMKTYTLNGTNDTNKGYTIPIEKLLEPLLQLKPAEVTEKERNERLKELQKNKK